MFAEIYTGSLYGQWPAAAVWASLLPLTDKHGRIDMSLQAIAGMTGWPIELLEKGIQQLMEPDPQSRTPDEDGRRLVPIDDSRPWGWRIVNHAKYREKARLAAKNARDVETGREAERKKKARKSAGVRRCPPATADDRPSNANAVSSKEDISLVFDHWQRVHEHPRAALDEKRKKVIRQALKSYSVEDLKLAIDGCKLSPFHQGKNDNGTKYDSISLILRDSDKIDGFMRLAKDGPATAQDEDEETRLVRRQLEDFDRELERRMSRAEH